jgi:hypothetical protein
MVFKEFKQNVSPLSKMFLALSEKNTNINVQQNKLQV